MAGCPFKGFEECPEHSKKGGCALWMSYSQLPPPIEAGLGNKPPHAGVVEQRHDAAGFSSETPGVMPSLPHYAQP